MLRGAALLNRLMDGVGDRSQCDAPLGLMNVSKNKNKLDSCDINIACSYVFDNIDIIIAGHFMFHRCA